MVNDNQSSLRRVLDALHAMNCRPKGGGSQYTALCPGHEDHNSSLSVTWRPEKGATYVHCHANQCDVTTALGLTPADLFDAPLVRDRDERPAQRRDGLSLVKTYTYADENGVVLYEVDRLRQPDGQKTFRQRAPDGHGGWKASTGGVNRVPYRLAYIIAAVAAGRRIWIVEGEKDVEALVAAGQEATCNAGGAGKWDDNWAHWFDGADVSIVADKDEPGQKHANLVRASLLGHATSIEVVTARVGKDAADHLAAGRGVADFVRPPKTSWTGTELLNTEFPPIRWAVPGLIPDGLTLFVGAPKMGKSWVVLDIALGIAHNGVCLGRGEQGIAVERGDVLYLALEDGPRRIKHRIATLLGEDRPKTLPHIRVETSWPKGQLGVDKVAEWLDDHPDARMVVVDTYGRTRGDTGGKNANAYQQDTDQASPWQELAVQRGVAIVLVHHVRKAKSEDFVNEVSGTNGLAGVADVTLALDRNRQEKTGMLRITGRDVEEYEHPIQRTEHGWALTGVLPEDPNLSDLSNQILSVLARHTEGLSPALIAGLVAQEPKKVRTYLGRLEASGNAERRGRGEWVLPASKATPPVPPVASVALVAHGPGIATQATQATGSSDQRDTPLRRPDGDKPWTLADARAVARSNGIADDEPIPEEYM